MKTKSNIEIANIQIISFPNELNSTGMSFTMAVVPRMPKILKMFEPIIFPIEISVSCFRAAIIEVANSGKLVPRAINDIEITLSLTPKFKAIFSAPEINQFDPYMRPTEARVIKSKDFHKGSFIICDCFLFLFWNF